MSGSRVTFVGDAMASVVQGAVEVRLLIGQPPVIVGGLAVRSRLSNAYRATTDLDVVDRLLGEVPQLEVLRAAEGAEPVEPSAVLLLPPTGRSRSTCWRSGRPSSTGPATIPATGCALHVERWFVNQRQLSLRRIHDVGAADVTTDDLDLVAELLADAAHREDG